MAIVRQSGTVDLIPEYNRQLRPVFCVSEGDDDSRVINLSITSGGEAFPIPSGAMVYIAGKKQDNNIFVYRCSYTSNTVVFPITAQMSADDGIVLCELQVIVDGDPLGSANFVYWVEPSPIQNGTASESDLNLFEQALAQFEKFDHFYADVQAMVTEAVANMQIREGQTVIDASLSVSGAAADAKATGDIVRAFMDALVTETTPTAAIATCDDAAEKADRKHCPHTGRERRPLTRQCKTDQRLYRRDGDEDGKEHSAKYGFSLDHSAGHHIHEKQRRFCNDERHGNSNKYLPICYGN